MPPHNPKIYHIVHVDRLQSIVDDRHLWSDARMSANAPPGPVIGMQTIKARRRTLRLQSHPSLPFYFVLVLLGGYVHGLTMWHRLRGRPPAPSAAFGCGLLHCLLHTSGCPLCPAAP